MLTLITQRDVYDEKLGRMDVLEQSYVDYYERLGLDLVPIPNNTKNIDGFLRLSPSLIILSGGNDVSPIIYGGRKFPNSSASHQRDLLETKILEFAIKNRTPLLGECRGMQFLNVYFKGGLIQDIKKRYNTNHVGMTHQIELIDEKFINLLGKERVFVNSYHNQGFSENELSKKLRIFAKTNEGIIEGLYHPSLPILGIMWHPEREGCDKGVNEKIIKGFLDRGFL